MEDILAKYPNLDAFTPTGGFPQFLPDAYEKIATKYKDKIASGALALVVADTLPVQIDLMKKGLSTGQVGQRPFEMGYKVDALPARHEGRQGRRRRTRPTPASTSARRRTSTPASAADGSLRSPHLRGERPRVRKRRPAPSSPTPPMAAGGWGLDLK